MKTIFFSTLILLVSAFDVFRTADKLSSSKFCAKHGYMKNIMGNSKQRVMATGFMHFDFLAQPVKTTN